MYTVPRLSTRASINHMRLWIRFGGPIIITALVHGKPVESTGYTLYNVHIIIIIGILLL